MSFTKEIKSVKEMIMKSKADGGDDYPEDVLGALDHALKFDF
jgi:hypothetical protein